jgi:hypothetical protein
MGVEGLEPTGYPVQWRGGDRRDRGGQAGPAADVGGGGSEGTGCVERGDAMTTFRVVGVRPGEGYIELGLPRGGGDHTDANGAHGANNGGGNSSGDGGGNGGERSSRGLCAQCGVYPGTRAYGLCWRCYYTPGVRRAHQVLATGRRGMHPLSAQVGAVAPTLLPPTPTEALPGTREKVGVLVERARLGFSLWHPLDAVRDPGVKPPGMQ